MHTQCTGDGDGMVVGQIDRDDTRATAGSQTVVLEWGAFTDAVLPCDQQAGFRITDLNGLNEVALDFETHARYTLGIPALNPQTGFVEPDGLTTMADEDDFISSVGEHTTHQTIVWGQFDTAQSAFARGVGVISQSGLFRDAVLGGHHQMHRIGEFFHTDHGCNAFALGKSEEGSNGPAFGSAAALGHIIDFFHQALTGGGEEKYVIVGAGGKQMFDKIFIIRVGADDAFAAPFLGAIINNRGALDKTEMGNGDDAALVGDDILHAEFAHGRRDFRATRSGVFHLHLQQLGFNQGKKFFLGSENAAQLSDDGHEFGIFGFDLTAFHARKLIEAQFKNGVGLALGKRILGHQLLFGFRPIG